MKLWSIDKLKPDPEQPRRSFNQDELRDLADNIKHFGILNAIEVRPDGTIISGERRYRAATIARLKEVPVVVRDVPDKEIEARQLAENVMRKDLTPWEIAQTLQTIRTKYKFKSDWAMAKAVGLKYPFIHEHLNLLTRPDDIQAAVKEGKIKLRVSEALNRIKDSDLRGRVLEAVVSGTGTQGNLLRRAVRIILTTDKKNEVIQALAKNKGENDLVRKLDEIHPTLDNQLKRNFSPGNRLIGAANDFAMALREVKAKDVAPLQVSRLAVALQAVADEYKTFNKKVKVEGLKAKQLN